MFCTESCWANIDFFQFHSVVWIDWFRVRAFGQTGLLHAAKPSQGFPCPGSTAGNCASGAAGIQATRQHTGIITSQLDSHYCSKLLHVGLRATSHILHLRWSSQVDLGVLSDTTDKNAWQNIRKSKYYYIVLAYESILAYQFSQPEQDG